MLEILSKIIGPNNAVSVYGFLHTRGIAILGALFLAAIVGFLWVITSDEDHEHVGFQVVPVLSSTPVNGDLDNGAVVSLRLPDGSAVSLTTNNGDLARSVTDTACVEQRVYVTSGDYRYRLKLRHLCDGT